MDEDGETLEWEEAWLRSLARKNFVNGATGEGGGPLVGYERRRVGDFFLFFFFQTCRAGQPLCVQLDTDYAAVETCARVLLSVSSSVFLCCQCFPPVSRISCNKFCASVFCRSRKIRPPDRLFAALALDNWSTSLLDQPLPSSSSSSSTCGNKAFLDGWDKARWVIWIYYPPFAFYIIQPHSGRTWGWTAVSVWWTVTLTTGVPTTDNVSFFYHCSAVVSFCTFCRTFYPSKIWGKLFFYYSVQNFK